MTALAAKAIAAPLLVGVLNAVRFAIFALQYYAVGLVGGVSAVVALAVTAVVVSIAALALIAWDLIFNDGASAQERFEDWLLGFGWIKAIDDWSNGIDPAFAKAWDTVVGFFTTNFAEPLTTAWETVRDAFKDDFTCCSSLRPSRRCSGARGRGSVNFYSPNTSLVPFFRAWIVVSVTLLQRRLHVLFFTQTLPEDVQGRRGRGSVGFYYAEYFAIGPFFRAWIVVRDAFKDDFVLFFTRGPSRRFFRGAWEGVVGLFAGILHWPVLSCLDCGS